MIFVFVPDYYYGFAGVGLHLADFVPLFVAIVEALALVEDLVIGDAFHEFCCLGFAGEGEAAHLGGAFLFLIHLLNQKWPYHLRLNPLHIRLRLPLKNHFIQILQNLVNISLLFRPFRIHIQFFLLQDLKWRQSFCFFLVFFFLHALGDDPGAVGVVGGGGVGRGACAFEVGGDLFLPLPQRWNLMHMLRTHVQLLLRRVNSRLNRRTLPHHLMHLNFLT